MKTFENLGEIFIEIAETLKPNLRYTVSQAAEEFVYLNTPGAYVGPYRNHTTMYMVEPQDTFASRQFDGMVFVGPAQAGKALPLTTPIATPTGWTTMGDLRVGDTVFSETGAPCKVVFATKTMHGHDCYDVHFDDGTFITADAEHRWFVRDDVREKSRVVTTEEMVPDVKYGARKHRNRYAIVNAGVLQTEDIDLPIDPYLLGVWLGDGTSNHQRLHLNVADAEHILSRIDADKYPHEVRFNQVSRKCVEVVFDRRLRDEMQKLDLLVESEGSNKHIPEIYLRAGPMQRAELLRGLLDTDGYVGERGHIVFTSILPKLVGGFRELVNSLGFKCSTSVYTPTYTYQGETRRAGTTFDINFFAYSDQPVFSLPRHLARLRQRENSRPTQTGRRRITAIVKTASVPVRCIQVDSPSHLFLAGKQMVPTHNTQSLILNPIAYAVKVAPLDMMIVCPTMLDGRDFSIRRLDRLNDYSEKIGSMLVPGASNDNTFDKTYTNGMLLTIGWPTRSQLAGKPIGRIVITDRDRMPDDIDGDGEVFDLASKRTTTFGSYAMTVAESSPSRPIKNLKWIPSTPHEAPPCDGILGLYNRGDRRRWQWPCPHCGSYFEGRFTHLAGYADAKKAGKTNLESAEGVYMVCPKNGCIIHPDDRDEMQFYGVWVKDGQSVDENGKVHGEAPRTRIASFWLNGVAATFTSWKKLVSLYLDAMDHFIRTGGEEALQKFYNNDLGEPYIPQNTHDLRLPEVLKARATKMEARKVPKGVRFLLGLADVQKNMWRCNVYGIMAGTPFDMVLIDRFDIRKSKREDHDGERLWVKPHANIEDWDELKEHLLQREYPLDDDSGRMMAIKQVGCDVQGKEGVTAMAYTFYRNLREENLHRRFMLTRGDHMAGAPRARIHYPDSNRKDQKAAARGDIPVLFFNTNMLKDDLNGRLDCITPGKGMYHFPDWLPDSFYAEMCSEVRTEKGWENPANTRNEDWDLSYMAIGLCVSELVRVEGIDWENPPGWASDWDTNDLVRQPQEEARFTPVAQSMQHFANLAKALA